MAAIFSQCILYDEICHIMLPSYVPKRCWSPVCMTCHIAYYSLLNNILSFELLLTMCFIAFTATAHCVSCCWLRFLLLTDALFVQVTVAVRCKSTSDTQSANTYITIDSARGKIYLRNPSSETNLAPSCRRQVADMPKFFAFDHVFSSEKTQVCLRHMWKLFS